jgi:hypothetical protein
MECNREGYDYDNWFFFYEDFNHFTTEDFSRLGQHHLKELRKQLKEEYRPPSTDDDEYERFLARFEALPIEAPVIKAPVIKAPAIEVPAIEAPAIKAPVIEAPVIEAPVIEALPIEAPPVDTNEPALLVETDEPTIPSANTTEPQVEDAFTFTIDYYFAGSSIPKSLSTTTLILPQSIPPPNSYLAYTLTFTYTFTVFGFQALQRTGVG